MGGSWETSLQGPMVRGGRWHVHCPLVAIFLLALSSSLASTTSPRDRVSCALLTHDGSLDSSFFQMAHLRGVSGSTHGLWAQPLGKAWVLILALPPGMSLVVYLISLVFAFPVYEMGIVIPVWKICCEN